jgi:hypothetical protein
MRGRRSAWASTLERCVDALGGRLEIHASFDDADADATLTA